MNFYFLDLLFDLALFLLFLLLDLFPPVISLTPESSKLFSFELLSIFHPSESLSTPFSSTGDFSLEPDINQAVTPPTITIPPTT